MMTLALPFQTRIAHFRPPTEPCRLPFALGSATQSHPCAVTECHNSQDAASIIITPNQMVGVVTDGCFGTHPKLEAAGDSSNEVGSKLLAYLVSTSAHRLAASHPKLSDEAFLKKLSNKVYRSLNTLLRTFCGTDPALRTMFAFDYLMATVLGFIVGDSRFLVFHSGDGVISVNGEISVLSGDEGSYITNDLVDGSADGKSVPSRAHALKLFRSGVTSELESIFLGSDGLTNLATKYADHLKALVAGTPSSDQVENGFDFLLQEFRSSIAWNPSLALVLNDDATFVMLRRSKRENV